MVEDTVTTEETNELSDEIEDSPSHPYDLPGEWLSLIHISEPTRLR